MRIQVQGNGSNTTTATDRSYCGINVVFENDDFGEGFNPIPLLSSSQISLQLTRRGETTNVLNGPILPLLVCSSPDSFEIGAVVANSKQYFGGQIKFGFDTAIINLSDDDQLIMSLSVQGAPQGTTTTATLIQGVGNELFTPQTTVYNVANDRSNQTFSLGGNVTRLAVVSESGNQTRIIGLDIASDKWAANYILPDMLAHVFEQHTDSPSQSTLSFQAYSWPVPLDNLTLNAQIDPSVTAQCWVVAQGGVTNFTTQTRAVRRANKHEMMNRAKFYGV